MTKNMWIVSMALAAALSAGSVMADQPATTATPAVAAAAAPAANSGTHPCKALRQAAVAACGSAGYVKGGHKNHKGLIEDCVRPILGGKGAPAGVTVDPGLVSACEAKRASKK